MLITILLNMNHDMNIELSGPGTGDETAALCYAGNALFPTAHSVMFNGLLHSNSQPPARAVAILFPTAGWEETWTQREYYTSHSTPLPNIQFFEL